MTGFASSLATGRVLSGERDVLYVPRDPATLRRAVIMCHGFGADVLRYAGYKNTPYQTKLAQLFAAAGYVVVAADFGGDSMGNDKCATGVNAAWALAKSTGKCLTDKVFLTGNSMGHGSCNSFTRKYGKANVGGIVGISPLSDIASVANGSAEAAVPGAQAAFDSAWGISAGDPIPAGADPLTDIRTHSGIPRRLYSSTNDPTVGYATVQNFVNLIPGSVLVQAGTQAAHSDPVMADIDLPGIVSYFDSLAAS